MIFEDKNNKLDMGNTIKRFINNSSEITNISKIRNDYDNKFNNSFINMGKNLSKTITREEYYKSPTKQLPQQSLTNWRF